MNSGPLAYGIALHYNGRHGKTELQNRVSDSSGLKTHNAEESGNLTKPPAAVFTSIYYASPFGTIRQGQLPSAHSVHSFP
jgi:hypothetical protein